VDGPERRPVPRPQARGDGALPATLDLDGQRLVRGGAGVDSPAMPGRGPIIGGNWKMHTTRASAEALARAVAAGVAGLDARVALFPPFPYLLPVRDALAGSSLILGAQDVHPGPDGAFTGEVSIPMLRDCGAEIVLCGHSERRHVIGESDALVARKVRAVLEASLHCVLCVGETLEERDAGRAGEINRRQLGAALDGLDRGWARRLTVAYEPVWAIGTGRNATPEQARQAHAEIRAALAALLGAPSAEVGIIYGGSVTPDNAAALAAIPGVDGFLVGGASLDAGKFGAIARSACARGARA
jgi:triosephosphate isomerase